MKRPLVILVELFQVPVWVGARQRADGGMEVEAAAPNAQLAISQRLYQHLIPRTEPRLFKGGHRGW
jgi:hypothetical protein